MTGIEDQGISTADLAGKSAPPAPDRGGDFDEGTSSRRRSGRAAFIRPGSG
jgi:hypothetical protein